jgi:hypothetical protein
MIKIETGLFSSPSGDAFSAITSTAPMLPSGLPNCNCECKLNRRTLYSSYLNHAYTQMSLIPSLLPSAGEARAQKVCCAGKLKDKHHGRLGGAREVSTAQTFRRCVQRAHYYFISCGRRSIIQGAIYERNSPELKN